MRGLSGPKLKCLEAQVVPKCGHMLMQNELFVYACLIDGPAPDRPLNPLGS